MYTIYMYICIYIPDRVAARPPRPLSGAKSQRSRLATPLCRSLFFQVRRRAAPRAQWPRDPGRPMGPKGGQGDPREPKGTQRDPRGPKGGQGDPRDQRDPRAPSAPLGGWAHGALWGYSEAIPNGRPFRVEGYYEHLGWAGPEIRQSCS